MQHRLSKIIFESNDPLRLYLEDFKASTTGDNIKPVATDNKKEETDDKADDKDGEENSDNSSKYTSIVDDIRDVLDKHNESVLLFRNLISEEDVSATAPKDDSNDDKAKGQQDSSEEDKDADKKKKLGDKLDIDDLIGDQSVTHNVIEKIAERLLLNIKNQTNIKDMQKEFKSYDIENLDKEQSEKLKVYLEKLKEDHPEGMIDRSNLKSFLTKPTNLPGIGKAIINPAQMKAGEEQKIAVSPTDIKFYQDNKIIPFMICYQDNKGQTQTLSGHNGGKDYIVVFIAPAFGAVMEDGKEVNLFKTLFPTFANEVKLDKGHIVIDCNELPFVYVDPEKELSALQATFSTTIKSLLSKVDSRRSDGKPSKQDAPTDDSTDESVFESFIYTDGISQLLNEENRSMDVLKFVNITAPDKTPDLRNMRARADIFLIGEKSANVIQDAYTSYLEIQKSIYEKEKTEDSERRADAIGSAIGSASEFASGTMKGFLTYGAVGSIAGTIGAGAVASAAFTMLPFVLGATVALPALDKSAQLGLRAFTGISSLRRKASLKNKSLDDQIEVVLKQQVENAGFQSIEDEVDKLNQVVIEVKEKLDTEQSDPEKGVKSDSDDYYKITTKDFLKLCSKKMLAFTEISDISSSEEKQKVFKNFLIGSNKVLNIVQVEIDEVAGMEIEEKTGQKNLLQKDIDFDNKDDLREVINELRKQIQDIDAQTVHQKAIKASILAALKMGNLDQATDLIKELKEKPSNWANRMGRHLEENKDSTEEEAIAAAAEEIGVSVNDVQSELSNMTMRKISQSQIKALVSFQKLLLENLGIKPKESEIQKSIENNENILVYKSKKELKDEDKERADVAGDDLIELIAIPSLKDLDSDSFKQMMLSYKVKDIESFNKSLLEIAKQVLCSLIYDGNVSTIYKTIESMENFKETETEHAILLVKNIKSEVQKLSQDVTTESKKVYYKNSLSSLLFEMSYSELKFNN